MLDRPHSANPVPCGRKDARRKPDNHQPMITSSIPFRRVNQDEHTATMHRETLPAD